MFFGGREGREVPDPATSPKTSMLQGVTSWANPLLANEVDASNFCASQVILFGRERKYITMAAWKWSVDDHKIDCQVCITHMLHGTGIFTYIYHIFLAKSR